MTAESTTPDPVELVRRGIESFSNGDLDAVMSDYSPDAVVDVSGWGIVEGLIAQTWHYRDIDEGRAAAERLAQGRV
jgi:ketosteroid isomerase-like protein